jgi:hypothetical protein
MRCPRARIRTEASSKQKRRPNSPGRRFYFHRCLILIPKERVVSIISLVR